MIKALVEAGVARLQVMEQLGISKASYYRCLGGYVGLLLLYSSRRTDTYALPPVVMCGLELALKTKLDCPTGRYAKFVILELDLSRLRSGL
jgi:hypothetical protein